MSSDNTRDLEKYTEEYLEPNFEDYELQYRRRKILEIMNEYRPQRIIEIGCGMEPLFKYYTEFEAYIVVEPSEVFSQNARKTISMQQSDKVEVIQELFTATDKLTDFKADFIICSCLLHEIPDQLAFMKDIYNVANKNTVIHINVPNANSMHRILAVCMGLIEDTHEMSERNIIYQQHNVFDAELLKNLSEAAGFRLVGQGSFFIKPFSHKQMFDCMTNNILSEKVLDGLYKMEEVYKGYGAEIYVNLMKSES